MSVHPDKKKIMERRAWQRFFLRVEDVENQCKVIDAKGRVFYVSIRDISLGGARVLKVGDVETSPPKSADSLQKDQIVKFEDCTLKTWGKYMCGVQGVIRWTDGTEAGCQFLTILGSKK